VIDGRDATRAAGGDDGTFDIPGRNGEPIDAYEVKMAELNARLQTEGNPLILYEELVAARLYSGPSAHCCRPPLCTTPAFFSCPTSHHLPQHAP
jgi:hypothetical protein